MSPATESRASTALIAELNDLLQLDHDALQSYALAIKEVEHPAYRETLRRFRTDHERHVEELTALIRAHGGLPIELPHPTGVAKLAKQAAGGVGGDRRVLLAFRANERQARDKYARAERRSEAWPEDVRAVVRRAADDETRHYEWADATLEGLGESKDGPRGRARRAYETVHARAADAVEAVGKQGMRGFEAARRGALRTRELPRVAKARPLVTALAVVGTGLLAAALVGQLRGSRRRSRG
jgi:rubrerythrin